MANILCLCRRSSKFLIRPHALRLSLPLHQQLPLDLVREEDLRDVPRQDESDQVPLLQYSGHSGRWTLCRCLIYQ